MRPLSFPSALHCLQLACARIGAVHSVVFGGFSSDALASRIEDCKSRVLITCNGAPAQSTSRCQLTAAAKPVCTTPVRTRSARFDATQQVASVAASALPSHQPTLPLRLPLSRALGQVSSAAPRAST